jgi:hypothetical protein
VNGYRGGNEEGLDEDEEEDEDELDEDES